MKNNLIKKSITAKVKLKAISTLNAKSNNPVLIAPMILHNKDL